MYMKCYGDKDANLVKSPAFKTVLEKFKKLRSYTDAGVAGRSWNDTTALLVTDKAGFQTVGDWAKGEFLAAGKTAGKERVWLLPGLGAQGTLHGQRRCFCAA